LLLWVASQFNPKAKLWVKGREGLLNSIAGKVDSTEKKVWFHFPSLGEFEQGRPVLEKTKLKYPEKKIVVTFFSPSGYEIHKNYPLVEHVFYLPVDNADNAEKFIRLINPESVIFTKYDYWYHYFNELNKQNIPLFMISAIFRKNQPFFHWYGGFQRKILNYITEIFVQDEESKVLLNNIGITNVIIAGDTRFDRVAETANKPKTIPEVQAFCSKEAPAGQSDSKIFIAGSTWLQDEKLIALLVEEYPDWKFIIAPHEISESRINSLLELFPKALRYSDLSNQLSTPGNSSSVFGLPASDFRFLLIDNIGMLSSLYQYGHIAYIGGGFGVGIHNTLEAAAFGLPVIFGPNYYKFREAKELINEGAAFSIKDSEELSNIIARLQDSAFRTEAGQLAGKYVRDHTGATATIINHIYNKLS